MAKTCAPGFGDRFVGDPVDVVTGAVVDSIQDFFLAGQFPLEFRRTYSSAWADEDRGLGRGYTHSFDHCLKRTLDGITYISPRGDRVEFPTMSACTQRVVQSGHVLTNHGDYLFLRLPDGSELIFENTASMRLRLAGMRRGGQSISVKHNSSGRLDSISSDGKMALFTWEKGHLVRAHVRLLDRTETDLVHYFYEGDLLVEVEDAYKHRLCYEYDAAGRLTKREDRRGYTFAFEYDSNGRCTHSEGRDGQLEVTLEYFPNEQRTRVTRGDGGVWEYHYDTKKTLTKILDAEGFTRSFVTRPEDGQIAFEIDGAGNKITYDYDYEGIFLGYSDEQGRVIEPKRKHSIPTTPVQYELGRFLRPTEKLPEPTYLQNQLPEDLSAALVRAEGERDGSLCAVRDVQGLLIREERDGFTRRYAYDPDGNLRWKIDFDGGKTEYDIKSFNHIARKIDPNGSISFREYTQEDTLHAVIDDYGTRTVFVRDLRGEVVGISRAGVWKERYRRDGAGRLIEKTDANGNKLYDVKRGSQGEVLERAFASGGFERFTYDKEMHVVRAETHASKCTFKCNYLGDRIHDLRDGKGVERSLVGDELVDYRVLGFLTRYLRGQGAGSSAVSKSVIITDPTGRKHRVHDYGHGIVTKEFASGRKETTQYHPAGHVLSRQVYGAPEALGPSAKWTRTYKYSGEGYIIERRDSDHGTTRFGQDAAHQLVAEDRPDGTRQVFEHDPAGNLTRNGEGSAAYVGNLLVEANGHTFEHDYRQAIRKEQWQGGFRWFFRDERDQLVRVESFRAAAKEGWWEPNPVWTAKYDALNRRIEKTYDNKTTTFYWDVDRLAAEVRPDGQVRLYIYADALAMTPMLLVDYASVDAKPESGTVYAVFADHLGCPERIEDMAGQVVWAAYIAPYGAVQVLEGHDFYQPLRWPGHYFDAELKLQYNRFRTYSPELGRYLEPDPLGRGSGIENAYAYTGHPLFRVDTHGLECPYAKGDPDPEKSEGGEPPGTKPEEEQAAPAPAPGPQGSQPPVQATKTGLGNNIDAVAAKSPSLQADLQNLKNDNWGIQWGPNGGGSYADRDPQNKRIVIDSSLQNNPNEATQVLAHEVGHATYPYQEDTSSKTAYLNGCMADEGAATMNNIKVQREIQNTDGTDIGIAGNQANHPAYNAAYDQYQKDGDAAACRDAIGSHYGNGERTSNSGQTYNDYYGDDYDRRFPPPTQKMPPTQKVGP